MLNIDIEHYHGAGIYKISNIKNNKVYIGSAVDCARRIKQHRKSFRNLSCNSKIRNDVINGGEFTFEIIWIPNSKITWFDLYEKEAEYIAKYNSFKCGKGKMAEQGVAYILDIINKRSKIIN